MNDTLYEKLVVLSERKKLISIYCNNDTEKFYAGYILGVNHEDILLQHITPNGKYDGYILKKTASVYRIGYDESYLNKVQKLYEFEERKHKKINIDANHIMISFLDEALKNNWIAIIELCDSDFDDIQGMVIETNSNCIVVQKIDDQGRCDGITYFDIDTVTRIECDTEEGQSLKLLIKEQKINGV